MSMEYEEVPSKADDKKSVWHYFLRARDKSGAKCKKCLRVLKCGGGSTSSLQKHLKYVHQVNLHDNESDDVSAPSTSTSPSIPEEVVEEVPKKKTKLTHYFESKTNPSMQEMVSRMAAMDGLPFRLFVESEDLIMLFKQAGHTLPKSAHSIRNIIIKEANKRKQLLIAEVNKLKKTGFKFSISFDEWTSIRNRRYISLNLHSQHFPENFKNLGLIRVYGSMPAKKCVEEIKNKLTEFGISLENDIVAETTDGCSVMTKFGKLLQSYHQKCVAHALQLAIIDAFYKKENEPTNQMQLQATQYVQSTESDDDEDTPLSELAKRNNENTTETSDNDSDDDTGGVEFEQSSNSSSFEDQYQYLISKVKKVVKIFRKSPTKNDEILQKYVVEDFHREYNLTIESKTRWGSLADTLERFLKLRNCIKKALIDLKSDIHFNDDEWRVMSELHEVLDIIKTVLEALCRRDATLLTADIAIKFAIKKLSNVTNSLGLKMLTMLKKRYTERRLVEASILSYLQNPDAYFSSAQEEDRSIFVRPTSDEMCTKIVSLLKRLNNESVPQASASFVDNSAEETAIQSSLTKTQELQAEIEKFVGSTRQTSAHYEDLNTIVKIEMALYENGGNRGRHLSMAFDHLLSIPPTSVEPERIFSSAGLLCSKIRSRLSDQSLDALIFLRTYYKEQKAIKMK